MGIYDRDYYREESKGLFLGGSQSIVATLIMVNVGIFLADWIALDGQISDFLSLKADLVHRPWNFWQLATYGFAHDPQDLMHVALNMFGLWIFGRELEMHYGRREFLSIYLTMIVIAGLCWLTVEVLVFKHPPVRVVHPNGEVTLEPIRLVGASGAVVGAMVLYVFHYPRRTFLVFGVLPVPAWLLASVMVLADVARLSAALSDKLDSQTAFAAHLAGAAWGAIYFRTRFSFGRLVPRISWKALKPRPKLRLHNPSPSEEAALNERMDQILDKIHTQGEGSLTRDERRFLEEASRRFQQKKR